MEESARQGETIADDWGAFTEREGRIGKECERDGIPFQPEDDYTIEERQAGETPRAKAGEVERKSQYPQPTFLEKPVYN